MFDTREPAPDDALHLVSGAAPPVVEADYVRRLAERNGETEKHFTSHFGRLLRAVVRNRRHRCPADFVDEVVQETFVRVLGAIRNGNLRDADRLPAFMISVCENVMREATGRASAFEAGARSSRLVIVAGRLTTPRHHDGKLWNDFDYRTDQTVDQTGEKLRLLARDGASAEEVLEFIKSSVDFERITELEARQLSATLRDVYPQMDQDGKKIFEKLDTLLQARVGNLHDASPDALSGIKHRLLDVDIRIGDPNAVVIDGTEMNQLMAEFDAIVAVRR